MAEPTGEAVLTGSVNGQSASASTSEPWREVFEFGLSRGNAKAIWQDLVDNHWLHRKLPERKTLRREAQGIGLAGSPRGDHHSARRRCAGRLRLLSDDGRSAGGEVSPHAPVRTDARLQPKVSSLARVPFQYAGLGRTLRKRLPQCSAVCHVLSFTIICASVCSRPTYMMLRVRSISTRSAIMVRLLCPAACRTLTAKAKSRSVLAMQKDAAEGLHHGHVLKCGPRSWRTNAAGPRAGDSLRSGEIEWSLVMPRAWSG